MTQRLPTAAAMLLCAALVPAQDPPARELHRPVEFVTGQDDNLFSLRRSQDDIHEWELALDELDDGRFHAAVERLHRLLQTDPSGVAPIGPGRFLGQRLAAIQTLANMPPGAIEAYEALVRREAGHLVDPAPRELRTDQLELLARRYPTSRAGLAAALRLGDLALERGDAHTASGYFRRALDATAIGSRSERAIAARIDATRTLVEPRRSRIEEALARLSPAARDVLEIMPKEADPTGWFAAGGGGRGCTPMSPPAGRPAPTLREQVYAPGFDQRASGRYAMMPVGDLDGIYVNTGRKLVAIDPLRDGIAWETLAPLDEGRSTPRRAGRGEVNHDMVLAAAYADDIVVAALQVPERSATVTFHNNLRIMTKIPRRRLFAFDRGSGKLVWSHFDHLDGPRARRFAGHDACGPPLIAGDTVYAPVYDRSGAIAFAVAAYDLATGMPKWRRLICSSQQEVNMFGNARTEFASSPLCLSGGVLYGSSNLGVAYAIDAETGQARWVTAYDVVEMPTTHLRYQEERVIYFMNNAPVEADGVVCMTPLDSPYALGIDAETGRLLWRIPPNAPIDGIENDIRWLAGALGDEFLLTGRGAIAVKARPGTGFLARQARIRQLVPPQVWLQRSGMALSGRPGITAERLWIGRRDSITAFDRSGRELAFDERIHAPSYEGGNLLLVDGIVVSLRLEALEVFLDQRAILNQVEERYLATPDDPAAILRLATLRSALMPATADSRERSELTDLYRRGLELCRQRRLPATHPVRAALQRELFAQAESAARAAFRNGAPEALDLLIQAREVSPDVRSWIRIQRLVLSQCHDAPERLASELDLLLRHGAGQTILLPSGPQPIRAYVLYRRTELPLPPEARVRLWQDLLENHPDAVFDGRPMSVAAPKAIAALIARHGRSCYAAIDERATRALEAAGDEPAALQRVARTFPNSDAARSARQKVLDGAARRGELRIACEALARELSRDAPDPRVLRRISVAAQKRGNPALALALARRLRPFETKASDWPGDRGRTYGQVLENLERELAPSPRRNRLGIPAYELARVRPRTPTEVFRLIRTVLPGNFPTLPDTPLYVVAGPDLLAIDVYRPDTPILFAFPTAYLEHVVVCGSTLVVPDLERAYAIDYRTGQRIWELPATPGTMFEGLGVRQGVLHLGAQPNDGEGDAELIGVEPLTGSILFRRALPTGRMRPIPKPIADGSLVAMHSTEEGLSSLHRIDPLTGETLAAIDLRNLQPEGEPLAVRFYPQGLCGDSERIYVPVDSTFSGDTPRLLAVSNDGELAWEWRGLGSRRLSMAALRGDRLVLVESHPNLAGRVTILRARDGRELQTVPLGFDVDVLNWRRSYLPTPAPEALVLSDFASRDGVERRLYVIGIEPGRPSFVETLSRQLGEIERRPLIGRDFLTFGVRPNRLGSYRLYSLRLADRRGALPGGQRYSSHRVAPTHALSAVGPYTILCCADSLVVFGPEARKR